MTSLRHDIDPALQILYAVYWSLSLGDILYYLGEAEGVAYPPTKENKSILHDFHKRVLKYDSIAGKSYEVVSRFIQEVCVYWAEKGIFVRTSGRQPLGIENMDFDEIKHLL